MSSFTQSEPNFAQEKLTPKKLMPAINRVTTQTVDADGFSMSYAVSANSAKPGILFIHGSPGRWQASEAYLTNKGLQRDFLLVSVDRLGWGKSTHI